MALRDYFYTLIGSGHSIRMKVLGWMFLPSNTAFLWCCKKNYASKCVIVKDVKTAESLCAKNIKGKNLTLLNFLVSEKLKSYSLSWGAIYK